MNMKRRDFSRAAAAVVLAPAATILAVPVHAQALKPVAGRDYQVLDQHAAVEAPAGKIEVVEFFSYMCPHCNAFDPTLSAWMKAAPKHVAVRRVPVHFLANAEVLQRTYYAMEALNLVEKLHASIFTAVHAERRDFSKAAAMADWMATQGVDKAKFMDQYNSFTTATKVTRATQLTNAYKVEGVPAMGVAGRFLTEGTAKGLQVVDALVADIKAGR
jgi:thiol:disulfide interchange protein DsbA